MCLHWIAIYHAVITVMLTFYYYTVSIHNVGNPRMVKSVGKQLELLLAVEHMCLLLMGRQTIDKVDQLLWAWFSRPRKSADKIIEP